jgi:ABC-type nitrate/sulfonate/bicarbonate transport system substrate-binding protein
MKRSIIVAAAIVLIALIGGGAFLYQLLNKPNSAPLEQVTVGHVPIESFALMYIAQNQGYFTKNGLNVTIVDYSTGATAVKALTSGSIDFAGSSEYVVAQNAVEKQNISIIASCGDAKIVDIIARNDHGITQPSDLKGKTVGTAKGVIAEFDLGRFLEANGMMIADVNLVYYPPSQFADAIGNGTLDAVVSWQLYSEQVKMRLVDAYSDWPLPTPLYSVLSCRTDWLSNHSGTVVKLVTALSQAQDYLDSNPTQALQIVRNRFNYTDAYLSSVWGRNNCTLTLDQKILNVMTEEANWMIDNNLTTQKTMPNFAAYIDTTALKTVKPSVVTLTFS